VLVFAGFGLSGLELKPVSVFNPEQNSLQVVYVSELGLRFFSGFIAWSLESRYAFGDLTLLAGLQEVHPACKKKLQC